MLLDNGMAERIGMIVGFLSSYMVFSAILSIVFILWSDKGPIDAIVVSSLLVITGFSIKRLLK